MIARAGLPVAALAAAVLAVALVAFLVLADEDGRAVQAEFENVRGLLEDNDVRLNGAKAGNVESIALTERGTALVTMRLREGIPAPRSDAAATVRPVDLLGDIYLSYSPGSSPRPLRGRIATSRTANVPRLADLLRAFRPGARAGLQAMIVELSAGLERRGVDLNRAAVELRPALAATDRVMAELGSQNASLRKVIEDSHRVTRQLSRRRADVGQSVTSFARTLRATADRARRLDQSVARLAPTLSQLRSTSGRLTSTAESAQPLAVELARAAPGLTTAMHRLEPFLGEMQRAVTSVRPTLRRARSFLRSGDRPFAALNSGLRSLRGVSGQLGSLTETLRRVSPLVSDALFDKVADQTREPGDQPFDPLTDPKRNYWRGAAVLSCHTFGMRIERNCLDGFLPASTPRSRQRKPKAPARRPVSTPQPPRRARPDATRTPVPRLPKLPKLPLERPRETVDKVLDATPAAPAKDTADHVLDFLLGP